MKRFALATMLAALAACGPAPSASDREPSFGEPTAETSADGFTLTLAADVPQVRAGHEIAVTATLGHDQERDVVLSGSGSGVVFFSVTRREDGLTSGPPVHTDDCARHVLAAGAPVTIPFSKSGGYSPDDPNADFLEIYFADPALSLPAGTWRIDAVTHAWIGEGCTGEPLELAASVEVVVTD
jgi:hypothetical protein